MPPKKSVSTTAAADSPPAPQSPNPSRTAGETSILNESVISVPSAKEKSSRQSTGKDQDGVGIDDLLLPRTLTSRLARGILPPNTSIQKDALLALTKSATVFISYLAATANEQSTKKTIGPNDIFAALKEMELGSLMELDGRPGGGRLERELEAWETVVKGKRKGYREKVKGRQSGAGVDGEDADDRGEPETKRARVSNVEGEAMDTSIYDGESGQVNGDGESHKHPKTIFSEDEDQPDDTYQDDDADATESEGNDEEDEDDAENEGREQDSIDNYGPDEQLRRDILQNGDDAGGTDDESD